MDIKKNIMEYVEDRGGFSNLTNKEKMVLKEMAEQRPSTRGEIYTDSINDLKSSFTPQQTKTARKVTKKLLKIYPGIKGQSMVGAAFMAALGVDF